MANVKFNLLKLRLQEKRHSSLSIQSANLANNEVDIFGAAARGRGTSAELNNIRSPSHKNKNKLPKKQK